MAKTILLVEDSEDDELLFLDTMHRVGLANPILVVRDGGKAIAYLKGTGEFANRAKYPVPAILLLDLKLPGVDGFAVLEWVKTQPQLSSLLLVVLSHYGETKSISRAYELGAHSFLTKPVKQSDLIDLANHFVDHWDQNVRRV